jgi:hypothetical protein
MPDYPAHCSVSAQTAAPLQAEFRVTDSNLIWVLARKAMHGREALGSPHLSICHAGLGIGSITRRRAPRTVTWTANATSRSPKMTTTKIVKSLLIAALLAPPPAMQPIK